MNAPKRLRIDYDSVTMFKNALGIWYESRTIFRIGEFVAKVFNSSKLLTRISDRPTNCKNSLRTDCANQLRSSRTEYDSATNPNICQFVAMRVNSRDSGPVWNRGIRDRDEEELMLILILITDTSYSDKIPWVLLSTLFATVAKF